MLDSLIQTISAAILSAGGTGAILYFVLKHTMKPIDAYLETKGKNLATHEDIMKLVDQVRETEKVKAEITDNMWDRQQRWTAKHAMYRELMESLHAVFAAAATLDAYTQHAPKGSDVIQNSSESLVSSWIRFNTVSRVAAITVSQDALSILLKIKMPMNEAPTLLVEGLRESVIALSLEARKDLGYPALNFAAASIEPMPLPTDS